MTSASPNGPNNEPMESEPIPLPPNPSSPDVIPGSPPSGLLNHNLPKNAQSIALLLKSFNIHDIQPCVIFQLQEFAHRYVNDVLQDALILSEHCNKVSVDAEDIKEAIQGRIHHSFAPPPSQDFVRELARHINKVPLPNIVDKPGVRLPQEKYCLTATSYQIVPDPSVVNLQLDHLPAKSPQPSRIDLGEESEGGSEMNDFTEVNDDDANNEKVNENSSSHSPRVKQENLDESILDREMNDHLGAEVGPEGGDDFEFEEVDDNVKQEDS